MSKRILVVDDDLYIRELYEEVLKNAGYEVQIAEDGLDGLQMICEGSFDLILLDMIMPKMDGLGVLQELSKNLQVKKIGPIILLSNLGNETTIQEAKKYRVANCLTKADITPDQLLAYVEKHLGKI